MLIEVVNTLIAVSPTKSATGSAQKLDYQGLLLPESHRDWQRAPPVPSNLDNCLIGLYLNQYHYGVTICMFRYVLVLIVPYGWYICGYRYHPCEGVPMWRLKSLVECNLYRYLCHISKKSGLGQVHQELLTPSYKTPVHDTTWTQHWHPGTTCQTCCIRATLIWACSLTRS